MSIYSYLVESVEEGKKFKIDLINKSLKIDGKWIIKNGKVYDGYEEMGLISKDDWRYFDEVMPVIICDLHFLEECYGVIKRFYYQYKYSVPRKESKKKGYFKALDIDNLDDSDLVLGIDRNVAQAILEGYILLASLCGWLRWDFGDNWFWQSKEDKDLVILKNWIE